MRGAYGSLMTEEERAEHRQKMHSFTTVGECKAYFDEHRAQMTARARDRGIEPGPGPRISPCERMLNARTAQAVSLSRADAILRVDP